MKKFLYLFFISFILLFATACSEASSSTIDKAFYSKKSDIQVKDSGKVIKLLRDDNTGTRHQKFLVKLKSNLTILIAHNIDLSKRINSLKQGDNIEFYGEYEWNAKGGVIHWTHHDPRKRHIDGWIKHKGIIYK